MGRPGLTQVVAEGGREHRDQGEPFLREEELAACRPGCDYSKGREGGCVEMELHLVHSVPSTPPPLSGQSYPQKIDLSLLQLLSFLKLKSSHLWPAGTCHMGSWVPLT